MKWKALIKEWSIDNRQQPGARPGLAMLETLRRDEDGAATIMTLFCVILMLMMGGIGIDIMRHEMHRAKL